MKEETYQPLDTGSYPSDTVPEDTETHELDHDEVSEIIRMIQTYKTPGVPNGTQTND